MKRLCESINPGAWLPICVGIGAAMGSAHHDMGRWVSLGAAAGVVLSMTMARPPVNRDGGDASEDSQ